MCIRWSACPALESRCAQFHGQQCSAGCVGGADSQSGIEGCANVQFAVRGSSARHRCRKWMLWALLGNLISVIISICIPLSRSKSSWR